MLSYHEAGPDLAGAIAALPGAPFPNASRLAVRPRRSTRRWPRRPRGQNPCLGRLRRRACASFSWNRILLGELELIGSNASAARGPRPCGWPRAESAAGTLGIAAVAGYGLCRSVGDGEEVEGCRQGSHAVGDLKMNTGKALIEDVDSCEVAAGQCVALVVGSTRLHH